MGSADHEVFHTILSIEGIYHALFLVSEMKQTLRHHLTFLYTCRRFYTVRDYTALPLCSLTGGTKLFGCIWMNNFFGVFYC